MLTAEGCRQRRERLWQQLDPPPDSDHLLLSDPIHLVYLANSRSIRSASAAGFRGYLLLRKDGQAKLLHDNRLPTSVQRGPRRGTPVVPWYDGQSPGHGPRQLALLRSGQPERTAACASTTGPAIPMPRRSSTPSPTCAGRRIPTRSSLLKRCMRATEAGHAWARATSSRA